MHNTKNKPVWWFHDPSPEQAAVLDAAIAPFIEEAQWRQKSLRTSGQHIKDPRHKRGAIVISKKKKRDMLAIKPARLFVPKPPKSGHGATVFSAGMRGV